MFDPKAFLDAAVSRLQTADKVEIVRNMLEMVARFVDQHDVVVPDIQVNVGIVSVSLSAKKLEDKVHSPQDDIPTDPNMRKPDLG